MQLNNDSIKPFANLGIKDLLRGRIFILYTYIIMYMFCRGWKKTVFGSDAKWFLSLERFRVQTFEWIGFAVESSLEFMVSVGVQNYIRPRINVILFCIYNVEWKKKSDLKCNSLGELQKSWNKISNLKATWKKDPSTSNF